MSAAMLTRSYSSFSSAWLNRSCASYWISGWNFSFDVLIILILTIFSRSRFCSGRWSLWIYRATWLNACACSSILPFLEVIWESSTLGILMILLLSCFISITLSWNTWKLLLTLGYWYSFITSTSQTWLNLRIRNNSWTTSCSKSHFLFVRIVFDCQFGFACLNLIAFLTYSFIWDIITLLFIFFFLFSYWHL